MNGFFSADCTENYNRPQSKKQESVVILRFGQFVVIGNDEFLDENKPNIRVAYLEALENLVKNGLVRKETPVWFVLSKKGFEMGRSLSNYKKSETSKDEKEIITSKDFCFLNPRYITKKLEASLDLDYQGKDLLKNVEIQIVRNTDIPGQFRALPNIKFDRIYPTAGAHLGGELQFPIKDQYIEFQVSIFLDTGIVNQRIKFFKNEKGKNFVVNEYKFYDISHHFVCGEYTLINANNKVIERTKQNELTEWKIKLQNEKNSF